MSKYLIEVAIAMRGRKRRERRRYQGENRQDFPTQKKKLRQICKFVLSQDLWLQNAPLKYLKPEEVQ